MMRLVFHLLALWLHLSQGCRIKYTRRGLERGGLVTNTSTNTNTKTKTNAHTNTNTNTNAPGESCGEGGWQPGESSGEPEVMTRTTLISLMRTPIPAVS